MNENERRFHHSERGAYYYVNEFEMWLKMASIHHDEEYYSQYLERLCLL